MTFTKQDLLDHGRITVNDFRRTVSTPLDTPENCYYALSGQPLADDHRYDDALATDSSLEISNHFQTWLPDGTGFAFHSLADLRQALENLDDATFLSQHHQNTQTFWRESHFPLNQLLRHLPTGYRIDRVLIQGVSDKAYSLTAPADHDPLWEPDEPTDVAQDEINRQFPNYLTSSLTAWEGATGYVIYETTTQKALSPVLPAYALPFAVYSLSQPHVPFNFPSTIWGMDSLTEFHHVIQTVADIPGTATTAARNVYLADSQTGPFSEKSSEPAFLEFPQPLTQLAPSSSPDPFNLLWLGQHANETVAASGHTGSELTLLNTDKLVQLLQQAQTAGLEVSQYWREFRASWEANVTPGLNDLHYESFTKTATVTNADNSGLYYEISDAKTGNRLASQLTFRELSGYLLTYLWA